MVPLRLSPVYKDYLWGGYKLSEKFNKHNNLDRTAESWELSCHKDGYSVICSGPDSGITLLEYIQKYGFTVLGKNCIKFNSFPILVKLIDACDDLSVQVHPDDEYALKNEGEYGKTEMWYVIDCDDDASILYGFKENITKEQFLKHIENNTLTEVALKVPVKKGDVFLITSGTLHAIGKGVLIAEIQQNSNTTYRIYDYNRKDINGKARELHTDKACDVINLEPAKSCKIYKTEVFDGYSDRILALCEYFTVHLLNISEQANLNTDNTSFEHFLVIEGSCILRKQGTDNMYLCKGDSLFLPAGFGDFSLTGKCLIIKTRID